MPGKRQSVLFHDGIVSQYIDHRILTEKMKPGRSLVSTKHEMYCS